MHPLQFYLPSAKESMTWDLTSHMQTSARKAVLAPFESSTYRLFCYPDLKELALGVDAQTPLRLDTLRFASLTHGDRPCGEGQASPLRGMRPGAMLTSETSEHDERRFPGGIVPVPQPQPADPPVEERAFHQQPHSP